MPDSVTINALEVENLKRVKAVTLTPTPSGLTVLGGRNRQGKTTVLDAIVWGLGGDRYKPDNFRREGASGPTRIKLTLSNGLTVERSGKTGALKVTDPEGRRHGQQLLNDFVEELALNLPKFLSASEKQKADTLLQIIGVGPKLLELEQEHSRLYQKRQYTGQEQRKAAAHADSLPEVPGAPEQEVSALELIQRQQAILYQNEQNRQKRNRLAQLEQERESVQEQIDLLTDQLRTLDADLEVARTAAADLEDQSTAELEESLRHIEETNKAVRTNAAKREAQQRADALDQRYRELTEALARVASDKKALLEGADLPLPGLSVDDGKLIYKGQPWDNMSGAEQLIVATAIVRKLNPKCGFVLLDKLEQLDLDTLGKFGRWLEREGLQAIATRVSTGDECSIIIEDGMAKAPKPAPAAPTKWQKGVF